MHTTAGLGTDLTLAEVLRAYVYDGLLATRTIMIGRVESFRASDQTILVKPLVGDLRVDPDDTDEYVGLECPVLRAFYATIGTNGYTSHSKPAPGDHCILLVHDRELDKWASGDGGDVIPSTPELHDINDVIAIPLSIRVRSKPLEDVDTDDYVLGRIDGSGQVRVKPDGGVHIAAGGDADQSLVRGEDLKQALEQLTVPTAFGPSGTPINAASFADFLSQKGKVK